jgi:hypothetical protein
LIPPEERINKATHQEAENEKYKTVKHKFIIANSTESKNSFLFKLFFDNCY